MSDQYKLVVSLFRTSLSQRMTSTQSTMTLQAVPGGDIEYPTWMTIEPDSSNAEIVYLPTAPVGLTYSGVVRDISATLNTDAAGAGKEHAANVEVVLAPMHRMQNSVNRALRGVTNLPGVPLLPAVRTISNARDVIDKEYADALPGAGLLSQFLVTKNGADPTLTINVAAGQYIKADQTNAAYAGGAAVAVVNAATNYVEFDTAAGTLSVNQVAFTTARVPLATVVAAGGTITSVNDKRIIVQMNDGTIDKVRTWGTVQSLTADNLQITTDANSANDAVRKSLLDASLTQLQISGTTGEAYSLGDALYVKTSDGKLYRADADADESTYSFVGFALEASTAADQTKKYVPPSGVLDGLAGLTAGSYYFLSGTTGAIALTPHATRPLRVAQALSTTKIRILQPKFYRKGSTTFVAVSTQTITCGFYPDKITLTSSNDTANTGGSHSTQGGAFVGAPLNGSSTADATPSSWRNLRNGFGDPSAGNANNRTQTGFDLQCSTYNSGTTTVYWEAETL